MVRPIGHGPSIPHNTPNNAINQMIKDFRQLAQKLENPLELQVEDLKQLQSDYNQFMKFIEDKPSAQRLTWFAPLDQAYGNLMQLSGTGAESQKITFQDIMDKAQNPALSQQTLADLRQFTMSTDLHSWITNVVNLEKTPEYFGP